MTTETDSVYADLHSARERLCRAQVGIPERSRVHREMLDEAVALIDFVGAYHCPQWSRYDLPDVPEPESEP
jgi:dihydroorotase-like cyclic amidohydrolase